MVSEADQILGPGQHGEQMLEDDHSCWAPDTSTLPTWGLRKLGFGMELPRRKKPAWYIRIFISTAKLSQIPKQKKMGQKIFIPHIHIVHIISTSHFDWCFLTCFFGGSFIQSCKSLTRRQKSHMSYYRKFTGLAMMIFPKKNISITCGWNHHLKPPSGFKKEATYQPHKPFLKKGMDLFPGLVTLTLLVNVLNPRHFLEKKTRSLNQRYFLVDFV